MQTSPLDLFNELDKELYTNARQSRELAYRDGSISKKHKYLIAIALDATHGSVDGVRALTKQALECGVTQEEVIEALRITNYISGVGSIYTAAKALDGIF